MSGNRMEYDREFREVAVRFVEEAGRPIAQVARDLGINEGTLGDWIARARRERQGRGDLAVNDADELKQVAC